MYVVVADYGGSKHCVRIQLNRRIHKLFRRHAGAKVMHLYAVFLYAAVLNVYYLPKAHAVLILANRAAYNLHGLALYIGADGVVAHHVRLLGQHQLVYFYAEGNLALGLYARALGGVHYLLRYHLYVRQVHALAAFYRRRLRNKLVCREEHCQHNRAVGKPFHFGAYKLCAGLCELLNLRHAHGAVVLFVQLVYEHYLVRIFQRAAAYKVAGVGCAVLGNVVVSVVRGNGGHIVAFALNYRARAYAAVYLPGYAVVVALREHAAVHEHARFNGVEVAAHFNHFLKEQHSAFLQLARLFPKVAVLFQLNHFHQPVHAHKRLLRRVARFNIVYMPRHVAALVRRYG